MTTRIRNRSTMLFFTVVMALATITFVTDSLLLVVSAESDSTWSITDPEKIQQQHQRQQQQPKDYIHYRLHDHETSFGDTTREQVLATRERRRRQLKSVVDGARKKLADHSSGEIELTAKEKKELEDQMDIFQRKLDTMRNDLEEWVRVTLVCVLCRHEDDHEANTEYFFYYKIFGFLTSRLKSYFCVSGMIFLLICRKPNRTTTTGN
jgi:hypothetical protein